MIYYITVAEGSGPDMEKKCPCRGDFLEKFIQPAILLLLCEEPAHGFKLLWEIKNRGLVTSIDTTGFYRSLQRLEKDGKLVSEWDITPGKKPRKVYAITNAGVDCLSNWQNTLHSYVKTVERISEAVDQAIERKRS